MSLILCWEGIHIYFFNYYKYTHTHISFKVILAGILLAGKKGVVGWCEGAECRGVPLIWIIVGQGPVALAVGAGGGCLEFFLSSVLFLLFLPLFGRWPDID